MVPGSPCMCMRHTATGARATASSAAGAPRAVTSFTMAAPATIASAMSAGLRVSTESGTPQPARASRTGSTRRRSSSRATGAAPGRVDSPPMSRMSAPSPISRRACATACSVLAWRPPSEKESGVTLTTPITSGRSSDSLNGPHCRNIKSGALLRRRGRRGGRLRSGIPRLRRRLRRLGRARRAALHDVVDLVGVERLPLEQRLRHRFDLVAVVLDQLARKPVLLVDDAPDFGIHLLHRGLGYVLVHRHRAAEEDLALVLAVDHRPELVAHAPPRHHAAREVRGALEVVGGPGRHLAHEYLFRDAAAEEHRDVLQDHLAIQAVAVLFRELHGDAQRPAPRDDRYLVHRVGLGHELRDDRVPRLVIRRVLALVLGHYDRAPLRPHDDLVLGALEIIHVHETLVGARRKERRLVYQVREVRPGKAR